MAQAATKDRDSMEQTPPQAQPAFPTGLLGAGGPDITVAPPGADIKKLVEDEAFMNEELLVFIGSTGDQNAPKAVDISVATGGITGPMGPPTNEFPDGTPGRAGRGGKTFIRTLALDQKHKMPRYAFEVLAHSKIITLKQQSGVDPSSTMHINSMGFSYNFSCLHDPNPKGQAWREKVLADPA
jgi:hypothetical protein